MPRHDGWPIRGCHVAALTCYCAGVRGLGGGYEVLFIRGYHYEVVNMAGRLLGAIAGSGSKPVIGMAEEAYGS
ncbi:hypothetical protein Tco_1378287 [Tanacetum coccineum]